MSGYRAFRYWSPTLGGEAARISMVDARGGEFYRIVPAESAKLYREARDRALDAIMDAIERGDQPGEVTA